MDKSVLDNEDTSSVEPKRLETEHSIIVETQPLDELSLPAKSTSSESEEYSQPLNEQPLDDQWLSLIVRKCFRVPVNTFHRRFTQVTANSNLTRRTRK